MINHGQAAQVFMIFWYGKRAWGACRKRRATVLHAQLVVVTASGNDFALEEGVRTMDHSQRCRLSRRCSRQGDATTHSRNGVLLRHHQGVDPLSAACRPLPAARSLIPPRPTFAQLVCFRSHILVLFYRLLISLLSPDPDHQVQRDADDVRGSDIGRGGAVQRRLAAGHRRRRTQNQKQIVKDSRGAADAQLQSKTAAHGHSGQFNRTARTAAATASHGASCIHRTQTV